ncbi:hypothetical protein BJX63DRAFT_382670 [Aspergillus granulosus]|uniref:Uncharacterized protein n=1 Tax=Aspergillus granulosus TaxID=176169 RepID=A0ABR4HWU7_9EURO
MHTMMIEMTLFNETSCKSKWNKPECRLSSINFKWKLYVTFPTRRARSGLEMVCSSLCFPSEVNLGLVEWDLRVMFLLLYLSFILLHLRYDRRQFTDFSTLFLFSLECSLL